MDTLRRTEHRLTRCAPAMQGGPWTGISLRRRSPSVEASCSLPRSSSFRSSEIEGVEREGGVWPAMTKVKMLVSVMREAGAPSALLLEGEGRKSHRLDSAR